MKITSIRISNILSFKYHDNIEDAEQIIFEEGLNIIIGENGAGKSTALEVINFIFKRVLYKQFNVNQDLYSKRGTSTPDARRQIITAVNTQNFTGFRLEPNWNTENSAQKIRLEIKLDAIDIQNINHIRNSEAQINSLLLYTPQTRTGKTTYQENYTLDISLNKTTEAFSVAFHQGVDDFGFEYLSDYNFYKELIAIYNLEHPTSQIAPLYESFTLISSYRNYHAFTTSISLRDQHPSQQMQQIKTKDFSKSLNTNEQEEPSIFGLVRLRVAEKHFGLISGKKDEAECEKEANELPFLVSINKKLRLINLECRIKLLELRTWQYTFEFIDLRRGQKLNNINSLSAGQKAIIHLVFESYGRGDLKGGVVIIDEPEIHLHYQFQNEYLQVVRELNREQNCQYILVTHSEALINSSTINQVKRFSLTTDGYTSIKAPTLTADQRILIKILDNTRSTYAFFAKKVLLVEGDTDRYFFKSIIQEKYPELDQEIAILETNGKGNRQEWSELFKAFGLQVYSINDLDFASEYFYPADKALSIKTPAEVAAFRLRNADWETRINTAYADKVYILKNGDLEHYLGIAKGSKELTEVINFCNNSLSTYLTNDTDPGSLEVREIIRQITL